MYHKLMLKAKEDTVGNNGYYYYFFKEILILKQIKNS